MRACMHACVCVCVCVYTCTCVCLVGRYYCFLKAFCILGFTNHTCSSCWSLKSQSEANQKSQVQGLPWWSNGKESTFQCRGHGFNPWWGTKIPHSAGQLSPRAATTELSRLNKRGCVPHTTDPTCSGACAPQLKRENPHITTREKPACHNEEPAHCNDRSHMTQRRSHVPQLRPDAAKK